jgi:hypothetical protein
MTIDLFDSRLNFSILHREVDKANTYNIARHETEFQFQTWDQALIKLAVYELNIPGDWE